MRTSWPPHLPTASKPSSLPRTPLVGDGGKGDTRRPLQTSRSDFNTRWDATFAWKDVRVTSDTSETSTLRVSDASEDASHA